jgi:ATP-dependent Lon protease
MPEPSETRDDTAFMDRVHAYLSGGDVPKIDKALQTRHFGPVSDFLSESGNKLRKQSRAGVLKDRIGFGGALSGRDVTAVSKTVSALLKLIHPGDGEVPDEDLEWAVRVGLESRRRVKEQQKRIGAAEFRNTHFSYVLGSEGVEKFVSTPELKSDNLIGDEPLDPGQALAFSPGDEDEIPGFYRIEINDGPGSGMKILNKPVPTAFKVSVSFAERNLYARAKQLVGDKDPKRREFSVQPRVFDVA